MSCSKWKAVCAASALAVASITFGDAAAASPPADQAAKTANDAAVTKPANYEASIPFADHGGIYDWKANGMNGIWVQSAQHQWFYGTFYGTCLGLDTAQRVGFVTNVLGNFDRWSSIIVPHQIQARCQLRTFVPSAAPPGTEMG